MRGMKENFPSFKWSTIGTPGLETPSEPNDPTRLFIKPAKEEQPEHDVIVETEPKTDVTVEVIQH